MLECTDCNATISRLYNRLFSEYDPKTSYVQNNILEKCLWCTSVLIKLCKLDVSEQVLKIPMYLPKNILGGSFFSGKLQVQSLRLQICLKVIHHRVFWHGFWKIALFKISEKILQNIFAIPFLTNLNLQEENDVLNKNLQN